MQTAFWKHAPSWAAKLAYGILSLVLAYLGAYASLYRFANHDVLSQRANSAMQKTGYRVTFDKNIQRSLFPRPTVTIRNARLQTPQGETDLTIGEVRVGMAWSSIFGQPEIEKLVLNHAEGTVYRTAKNEWNVASWLPQEEGGEPIPSFNRIMMNDSRLNITYGTHHFSLQNIQLQVYPTNNGHAYRIQADTPHADWQNLHWQAQGTALLRQGSLHLPDIRLQFNGKAQDYTFTGSLQSAIQWQHEQLSAKNIRITADGEQYQTHLSATIDQLTHRHKEQQTLLKNLTATVNTAPDNRQIRGTLRTAQAQFDEQRAHSDEIQLNLNHSRLNNTPIVLTLNSGFDWQRDTGVSLNNFKLTTLQGSGQESRFSSEWEGSLHWQDQRQWHVLARGLLDRQPAQITLSHQPERLDGIISINKLDLNPYVGQSDAADSPLASYPEWLAHSAPWQMQLSIGNLILPKTAFSNVRATVKANERRISFDPLKADWYDGQSTGSLHILNHNPVQYQWQQHAENVQMQPLLQDLFAQKHLAGKGEITLKLQSQGAQSAEWLKNLSGSLSVEVKDGEWSGIDFSKIVQTLTQRPTSPEADTASKVMPFSNWTLSANIRQGISRHRHQILFLRPAAEVFATGEFNLAAHTLKEDIVITGKDSTTPLPLRVSNETDDDWDISLNYQKITEGLKTPEEKQQAISDTLKQQWQWLKQQSSAQPEHSAAPKP